MHLCSFDKPKTNGWKELNKGGWKLAHKDTRNQEAVGYLYFKDNVVGGGEFKYIIIIYCCY